MAISEQIAAADELRPVVARAPVVHCAMCKRPLFFWRGGGQILLKNLVDNDGNRPAGPYCPHCNKCFFAVMNGQIKVTTDKGLLP